MLITEAANAVKELTLDYDRLYKMNVYGEVTTDKETGVYNLCVIMDGNRGQVKACIQANKYDVEDIEAARGLIPKLHQEFIKLLYRKVREVIW